MKMRTITIKITDDKSGKSLSGTTTLEAVNDLYRDHKINGITQVAFAINSELNQLLNEDFELLIPNELTTLPKGKKW